MRSAARLVCVVSCLLSALAEAADPDTSLIERALNAGSDGNATVARELGAQAAAACGKGEDATVCLLTTHILLSRNYARRALYVLSLESARAAATVAKRSNDEAQLSTQLSLAGAAARSGELEEAEAAITVGRAVADEMAAAADPKEAHNLKLAAGMFGGPQALVYSARGEHVRAVSSQRMLVKSMRSFNPDHANLSVEIATLADLQVHASDERGARESYAEAIALAQRHGKLEVRDKARAALMRLDAAKTK